MADQRKFGRYEISGELGHGGMATVYHATDPSFGREVAIKVLPLQLQHNPQFRERFQREGRTIAGLEHPNIVPVYDVGEEDGVPFLVMRYMQGGTLNERIPADGMPLSHAAHIIERIAAALDAAHKKNIVHRDLKPSNILFDQYGEAYISDFGIVKLAEETMQLTGSGVIGTPTYMSPEQASGAGGVDGRSDVYSLAVVLYEMLTGKLPFEAETPMAIAVKHITAPVPDILTVNDNLPAGLHAIMHKALAKEPSNRYQTAGALSADLNALISGQPIAAEEPDHDHLHAHTMPMTAPSIPLATGTRPANPVPPKTVIETATAAPPTNSGADLRLIPLIALGAMALIVAFILIVRPFRRLQGVDISADRILTATAAAAVVTDEPTDAPTPTSEPTIEPSVTAPPTEEANPLIAERDLADAEALTVDLGLAAASTTVIAADEGITTIEAEFIDETGEADVPTARFDAQSSVVTFAVDQRIPDLFVADEDPIGRFEVRLPRHVPIDLRVRTGFGNAVIDLRGLNIRSLTVHENYETTVFLPSEGELEIVVEENYAPITFEAPEDTSNLTISSIRIVESFAPIQMELPAVGSYQVNVATYNEVQFYIPASIEVSLSAPAEQVTVTVEDPRFTETAPRVWSTDGTQGENLVTIIVDSQFGTIVLKPLD